MTASTCKVVPSGPSYVGQQGFTYLTGLTGPTVGSRALCMTLLTLPDGARAKTHFHHQIETGAYVIEGRAEILVAHSAADDQAGIELLPHLDGVIP